MNCKRFLVSLILGGLFLIAVCANIASAQCCGTPAVATFAPAYTTAYAPQPVVWQTYRPTTGWYPGALIDRMRINRWERRNDAVVVTAGYAPTYTAAYTPTFPPSYFATSYRPVTPIGYSVGFAPAASSCSTCGFDSCGCSREVVMRPICDSCSPCGVACSGCATGCSSCVGQAVYESSGSTGCAGCAGGSTATSTYITQPAQQSPTPVNGPTPAPAVDPNAPVPEQRETRRADEDSVLDPEPADDKAAPTTPSTMFQAPELYDPANRVTKNAPNVPVWTAVYHSSSNTSQPTSHHVSAPHGKQPTAEEVVRDAQGWSSAGK